MDTNDRNVSCWLVFKMKRSEMIKLIRMTLEVLKDNNLTIQSDLVLETIENEGMLPPGCDYYSEYGKPNHVWEPENE